MLDSGLDFGLHPDRTDGWSMTPDPDFENGVAPLKLEAMDWAARLTIGPVGDADWAEFEVWRRLSPAHDAAFRNASEFMDGLRGIDLPRPRAAGDKIVPLDPRARMSRRHLLGGGAIAASLAAGIIAARSPLGLWPSFAEMMADRRTLVGERARFSPVAGVDIDLGSRSSVARRDDGVTLIAGEMFVTVDRQVAGYGVDAADGSATATDAAFNVRSYDGETCFTCVHGRVEASRGTARATLGAGDAVTYAANGGFIRSRVRPEIATGWRRGLLIFEGTPLGSAVAQINRYYPGRLVVRGASLAARPITGTFHVDQIALTVVQIENLTGASATHLPGGLVLLG